MALHTHVAFLRTVMIRILPRYHLYLCMVMHNADPCYAHVRACAPPPRLTEVQRGDLPGGVPSGLWLRGAVCVCVCMCVRARARDLVGARDVPARILDFSVKGFGFCMRLLLLHAGSGRRILMRY